MAFEIIVTALIITAAAYILYKNVKRVSSGKCSCGDCSNSCTGCKNKGKDNDK